MDFRNVNSSTFSYYLERIHGFLLSDKKTQIFPDISKDIEAILIKISTDKEFLLCDFECFDDDCKSISRKILDILERNKHVFRLTHSYEKAADKTVLVYKKTNVFMPPPPLRAPCTIKLTPISTPLEEDTVTTSFKLRCLNATLKFIKDDNQLFMKFPDMAPCQAEFVHSMLSESDLEVGFGYKSLFAPIRESMKIFGLKFNFKVSYVEPRVWGMKCVLFEKIPINARETLPDNKITPTPNNVCTPSIHRTVTLNQNQPASKKVQKSKKLKDSIKELNPVLMNDALKKISEFLTDEQQGSIMFVDIKPEMMQFIQNYKSVIQKSCYHMYLSSDSTKYINLIKHYENKKLFKVDVKERKTNRMGCRTLELIKNVCFDDKQKNYEHFETRKSNTSEDSSKNYMNKTSTPISLSRSVSLASLTSIKSEPVDNKIGNKENNDNKNAKPILTVTIQNEPKKRCVSAERKSNKENNLFKSSSSTKLNSLPKSEKGKKLNITKVKLIEGLSQPVKSDIGMKMMLSMGWQGGALGLRGEGITEPITLHLDNTNRAGLGCVKPEPMAIQTELSNKPQTVCVEEQKDYHCATLNNILHVLTENLESKIFIYPPKVLEKEWNFIKHVIKVVNIRGNTGLANELQLIADNITKIMRRNNEYILTALMGSDQRSILITKTRSLFVSKNEFWIKTTMETNNQSENTAEDDFKLSALNHILEICTKDITYRVINATLTKKQKSYLRNVIKAINNNKSISMKVLEGNLCKQICSLKRDYQLIVEFYLDNFCIKKKYSSANRKINTSPSVNCRTGMYKPHDIVDFWNKSEQLDKSNKSEQFDKSNKSEQLDKSIKSEQFDKSIKSEQLDKSIKSEQFDKSNKSEFNKTYNSNKFNGNMPTKTNGKMDSDSETVTFIVQVDNIVKYECDEMLNDSQTMKICDTKIDSDSCVDNCDISIIVDSDMENDLLNSSDEDVKDKTNFDKNSANNFQNGESETTDNVNLNENVIKRKSNTISSQETLNKKVKSYCKKFKIVPKNYPASMLDKKDASEIQNMILDSIDYSKELPLLKCHGLSNGGLKYSCLNEFSFKFINDLINDKYKIVYNIEFDRKALKKMMFKINTFFEENVCDTLATLSMYNKELDIDNWVITKKEQSSDFVVVYVTVDKKSFNYIRDNNFSLYAGVDKAKFSVIWD